MKMDIKRKWPVAALSIVGMAGSTLNAARDRDAANCAPAPPATCYEDECRTCYCLGPENYGVNAPVRPKTCNGDWVITVAGFYWNSHQDGMQYAIDNGVIAPIEPNTLTPAGRAAVAELNNLVDAEFERPDFGWDFGFKLGLGYNTTCDGWDIGVLWTWYKGKANSHIEAEEDDNRALLPIWSAYAPKQGFTLYATDIRTDWSVELNLIDIELGREFWTSKYLSLRPHMGIRVAYLSQTYEIQHSGGAFRSNAAFTIDPQRAVHNTVEMENDFSGAGIRAGLDTNWNLGCGWSIYGNLALSIVYGKFDIDYDERNREVASPHDRRPVAETHNHFCMACPIADLGLGVQYHTMFCDCAYGFAAMLGWEHHLFFNQNQMWRIMRLSDFQEGAVGQFNNTGENIFNQRRGDLDTQGWTLTLRFEF